MGLNMMADGSRIRNMEWESTDLPMGIFSKACLKMAKLMALVSYGFLVATSSKAFIEMVKGMASI
jgi:hypothetical protein